VRLWLPDVQASRERMLCGMPLSTAWALTACVGAGVLSAATFVLTPDLHADALLSAADDHAPTLLVARSATYTALVDDPGVAKGVAKRGLSSLRICLAVGEPLSVDVAARFESLTGSKLREAYGLAEAGSFTHANPVYGMVKSSSIGLPLTDTVCIVVDRHEPTRLVEPGQPGELAIHGPQVMRSYWRRASETATVLRDGWLLTGDVVEVDEDGYFHLVDQKRDVIDVSGRRVSPRDVEAVLVRHPKVAKAAVAGIPEFTGGEMLKAYLVLTDGETATTGEIDEFCRAELAPHQVPKRYEFRAFLPHTPPGKPMRDALVAEELGGSGLQDMGL
jgi:long-chain acyl-CoA synthetase